MIEREREELILRILRTDQFVTVGDIVGVTGASEATVRRDFARLEERGLLRRVRGGAESVAPGAVSVPSAAVGDPGAVEMNSTSAFGGSKATGRHRREIPTRERVGLQSEQKRQIARHAASYCHEGDTIFVDGGSTTVFLVEFLMTSCVTAITNSFAVADKMRESECCQVFLPGGQLDPHELLIQDPTGRDFYRDYAATTAFLGVEGIDERGLTNTNMQVVQSQRQMIAHAKRVIVLADASKFESTGHLLACRFDDVDVLITNAEPPQGIIESLDAHGVDLQIAGTR
ncbi:MAG: DeoR family transcriptional regulator [Spirochaetes bacterium]|jgi:DeoR family ulaG and ulaABCDEF operon transcriptional repressor|nr:DeoR family transcriptional regulator [Spirochaetota bacterium]